MLHHYKFSYKVERKYKVEKTKLCVHLKGTGFFKRYASYSFLDCLYFANYFLYCGKKIQKEADVGTKKQLYFINKEIGN